MSVSEEVIKRPFRLWDPKAKVYYRWRCYKYHRNAIIGALIEVKWAPVGTTIEVMDERNGKLVGAYTRRVNSVTFTKERTTTD